MSENESNNSAMTPELSPGNTGVLPPAQEEAVFENVNSGENNNSPLGNAANVVEVPATAVNSLPASAAPAASAAPGGKRPFKEEQAEEMAKLKSAIATAGTAVKAKAPVAAKLASARIRGDAAYEDMFSKAVSGTNIASAYETNATRKRKAAAAKRRETARAPRNSSVGMAPATVINTTARSRGVNGTAQTNMRRSTAMGSQTNMRRGNIVNSSALSSTVDSVVQMIGSIEEQIRELKRTVKTLKMRRPAAPRAKPAASLAALPPLPAAPEAFNAGLNTIPEGEENGEFTGTAPPPL
jgi:hypothetical protein